MFEIPKSAGELQVPAHVSGGLGEELGCLRDPPLVAVVRVPLCFGTVEGTHGGVDGELELNFLLP